MEFIIIISLILIIIFQFREFILSKVIVFIIAE